MPIFVGTGTRQRRASLLDAPRRPLPDKLAHDQAAWIHVQQFLTRQAITRRRVRLGYDKLCFSSSTIYRNILPPFDHPWRKKIFGGGLIYKEGHFKIRSQKHPFLHCRANMHHIYPIFAQNRGNLPIDFDGVEKNTLEILALIWSISVAMRAYLDPQIDL